MENIFDMHIFNENEEDSAYEITLSRLQCRH